MKKKQFTSMNQELAEGIAISKRLSKLHTKGNKVYEVITAYSTNGSRILKKPQKKEAPNERTGY